MGIVNRQSVTSCGTVIGVAAGIAATVGQQLVSKGLNSLNTDLLATATIAFGGGVAVNLVSNVVQKVCRDFSDKVVIEHPDKLNHNLQKSLFKAVDEALRHILVKYSDTAASIEDIASAKAFISKITPQLHNFFEDTSAVEGYHQSIDYWIHKPRVSADQIVKMQLASVFENSGTTKEFRSFFENQFVWRLRFCFAEELKKTVNEPSWIAFQKMMIESLKDDTTKILANQKTLSASVDELKKIQTVSAAQKLTPAKRRALEDLLKELNHPDKMKSILSNALDEVMEEIRTSLYQLQVGLDRLNSSVDGLISHLTTNRKGWWDKRMVIAYVAIIILLISSTALVLSNISKPFNVSLIVESPANRKDLKPKTSTTVTLQYGNQYGKEETKNIAETGEVIFTGISGLFRGDEANIFIKGLDGEPLRPSKPVYRIKLYPNKSYKLSLVSFGLDQINGIVTDESGHPIEGATIIVQDIRAPTDSIGYFRIHIPVDKQERYQDILILKKGFRQETLRNVAPYAQSTPLQIQLKRHQ